MAQMNTGRRSSYSCWASLCGTKGESCSGLDGEGSMGESMGETSKVGVLISTSVILNGGLCGKGDISIMSMAGAGDDEGNGGVVIVSSIYS